MVALLSMQTSMSNTLKIYTNLVLIMILTLAIASCGLLSFLIANYAAAAAATVQSLPKFKIVAVIPNEKARPLSRELSQAVSRWQKMIKKQSFFNSESSHLIIDDTSITLNPISVGNDTQRLLDATCDALEINNPSLILSLLESRRNYYLKMVANKVDVPILSLTSDYRESFQSRETKVSLPLIYCSNQSLIHIKCIF